MIANMYHQHFHATALSYRAYVARDRLCADRKVHLIRQMLFDEKHGLMVLKECTFLNHSGRVLDAHDYLSGWRSKHYPEGPIAPCDGSCAPIHLPLPQAAVQALHERGFASRETGYVFESSRWDGIPEIDVCVGGFAHVTFAHEREGDVWRNARPCNGDCHPKHVHLDAAIVRQIAVCQRGWSRGPAAPHGPCPSAL